MPNNPNDKSNIRRATVKRPSLDDLWLMDYDASNLPEALLTKADKVVGLFARGAALEGAAEFLEAYKAETGGLPTEPGQVDCSEQYYAWAISQMLNHLRGAGPSVPGFDKRRVRDAVCALYAEGKAVANCSEETELGIKSRSSSSRGGKNSAKPEKTEEIRTLWNKVREDYPENSDAENHRLVAEQLGSTEEAVKKQISRKGL